MTGFACVGFLTDYGDEDAFVAVCHAVMARLAPSVRVIDVTHRVPPQDVRRGAAVLAEAAPWFPPAVLLAVVDPGVGTSRRAVAVEAGDHVLVGPDNGLLSWAWDALGGPGRAVDLDPRGDASARSSRTFHGRDLFAPAAARLAGGESITALGRDVDPSSLTQLATPVVRRHGSQLISEVLTVDRFGNLQLAARPEDLPTGAGPTAQGMRVRVRCERWAGDLPYGSTFGDVPPGDMVLLADSAGRLALAANGASAQALMRAAPGDVLTLEPVTG